MGCVSSSEADVNPEAPRPETSAVIVNQDEVNRYSVATTTSSGYKSSTTDHQLSYDTELAASLVEGGGKAVAYHGLLVHSGRLSLKRSATYGNSKVFTKSIHPSDDGSILDPHLKSSNNGLSTVTGVAMTMPYTIIVAASSAEGRISTIIGKVFNDANAIFNGWNPDSEISKLNCAPPGKGIQVSSDLLELFDVVNQMNSLTGGRFDPTTGALNVAFENCIKSNARPPLPSEVKPLKFGIGWRKRLERSAKKITRTNANTVVDLDGISKGFVIDKLVTALVAEGYGDCYVDWAGDVRAKGNHPSGRPWRSAVMIPPSLRRMFGHWQMGTLKEMLQSDDIGFFANFSFLERENGGAIATSGDYFSIQKYGYHHIASGEDLTVLKAGQTSVASVCIAAATCAVADAIATAAMTFRTVHGALEFLQSLQTSSPEIVSGFCVMSRDQSQQQSPGTFTSTIFVPALDTDSSTTDTQAADSRHDSGVSEEAMRESRKQITRDVAEIHFNNARIRIDSFGPCSMEPEQLAVFISPLSFVSSASVEPESDLNKLFGFMLGFQEAAGSQKSVRVDMRFRKIVVHGNCALVVAAIVSIDLGSVGIIEVPFRTGVSARKNMKLSVPRSTFSISPLVRQVKELFRQVPAILWILGTKSADQVELAITASSVTVPHVLENMLCFNITHTSTFFAGIGGVGSRIRGHALSIAQKELADTFVSKSSLNLDAITALESDSIMTTDCTVELVESVQDHIIVLARINEVRYNDTKQVPLLWLQGNYLEK